MMINYLFIILPSRLRHVNIHQTVRTLPEREGLRLPPDGFWFHQSEERVSGSQLTVFSADCLLLKSALGGSSRAEGVMRTMTTEKLLKGMPVLQTQIDTLLEFDVGTSFSFYFSDSLTLHLMCCSQNHTHYCACWVVVVWRRRIKLRTWGNVATSRHKSTSVSSGSSQRAEQRHHQRSLHAPVQGPGQTVRVL